jgi:hypothetical protein
MSAIPLPEAISTIHSYPLAKVRVGMPAQEYIQYKANWKIFNRIWAYNYSVSTLNGSGTVYAPYEFASNAEVISYVSGQAAHIAYYSDAGAAGVFNNFY